MVTEVIAGQPLKYWNLEINIFLFEQNSAAFHRILEPIVAISRSPKKLKIPLQILSI